MQNSFGEFLKQKRQEKKLTQKQLAEKLFVTESAVSKWEKDVAHPDIILLPKLSEILGVSEHEIITASIDKKSREEKSQAKKWRTFSMSWSLFFYIAYGLAIISCFICNLAIDKTLSWFFIVSSALVLAFTFTNLPKLIKKHKLILIPLSMFLALCLLLAVCCIYVKEDWFWVAMLSVFLGLTIIFVPIYISKFKTFEKIKKYNDFVSVVIDFVVLNILLIVVDFYAVSNGFAPEHWCLQIAFPITALVYLVLNLFLTIRFLKVNKLLKTSIILFLANFLLYGTPLFLKVGNAEVQQELDDLNILKADFSNWIGESMIEHNVHLIICLSLLATAFVFLTFGIIFRFRQKEKQTKKTCE